MTLKHRILAVLLALCIVFTLIPAGVIAAEGTTIAGTPVTVDLAEGQLARENDFNKGWKFNLGDNGSAQDQNFNDSSWSDVDLPHDFSITQHFTASGEAESGFLPGGTGWYRKSFVIGEEAADKTFLLNFDGVYMHAYVYVNGNSVGEHHYGYTNFAFDITEHLFTDGITENVVAVKAVNNIPSSRWYSGSGIYRDVTLLALDPVHVDLNGTYITTPDIANGTGTVNVKNTVVNDGNTSASVSVKTTVYKDQTAVANATETGIVAAGSSADITTTQTVSSPALWSIQDPNLYKVVTEVTVDGKIVDTTEETFGFRWFTFNNQGFHLNGQPVKLNGVCLHHDQGGLGAAAYYDAMYRQLSIMKDMGCNAIRTSHNPADEQFIEICNELGLLVIEETFDGLVDPKNENTYDFSGYFERAANNGLYGYANDMTCAEYATRSIVKRDRNDPCIFAWSFGNEIQEGTNWTNVGRYDDICANYISWVNDVDGTRVVTSGDNNRGGDNRLVDVLNTILNNGGVVGFNYANSASQLSSLAQSYGGVIIASETSSATNSRGQYKNKNNNGDSDGKYHLTSYDTSSVSWGITAHDSIYNTYQNDCVAGEFVWTGFDYIGEPTPWNGTTSGDSGRGAIPNSSYFGIVETTGFEKDSYYLYRSQWNKEEATVHLVTAWDGDNQEGSSTTGVWLYSNAPKVELYRGSTKIATATRQERKSAAGHIYYTYSSVSNNDSICTVANGSGSTALYGAYNIAYDASTTLYAKAYDENNNVIPLNDSMGRHTVTTPDTVTQLKATVNKTEITADGSSLAYVEIDVLDANGNPDTTATNNITFTLEGPGEIAAVDNGDQATVRKYQNSYVKTSDTTANINAYAGKALVIVRSTEDAGTITLNVAAEGLNGQTVTINTTADTASVTEDLVSYTMVKDYTVKAGTNPALNTSASGTKSDGTTVSGTVVWDEIPESDYGVAGDYTITGTLTLEGQEPMPVSGKLHVIPNIIDLRNVSTATIVNTQPTTLPDTVRGVLANGELAGEFNVTWNAPAASAYSTAGDIVTVTGTAVIFGTETMDVTCTVRVAEPVNTESTNVAPMADSLTQDIAPGKQSDNLSSIKNGTLKPGDNTNERWSNWNNRTTSADATLTLTWATAQTISSVNLYYYYDNCCAYPQSLEFSYSLNGQDYTVIGHTAKQVETYSLGAMYSYTFDTPINPVGLKVKLTQQDGTNGNHCVGLTELQVMTYAASLEYNTSEDLSGITVNGKAVDAFAADKTEYEVEGDQVAATTAVNAGITILPAYEGVVRILTVSEDGSAAKTYELAVAGCQHADTVVQNASAATCTASGYTGDTYCNDCKQVVSTGTAIEAKGHKWNKGVVTKEATETENGLKTFTCTVCGATKEESYALVKVLKVPSVSLSVTTNSDGKIIIKGAVDDFENLDDYCQITSHGVLYIRTSRVGNRLVTVDTNGRTRVNFSAYKPGEGSFTYKMTPVDENANYAIRAFLIYIDQNTGRPVAVYSDMIRGCYNTLK